MNKLLIFILTLAAALSAKAEPLNLEKCLKNAESNSAFVKKELINKAVSERETKSISNNYLPKLSIDGQATYQSDVFALPIKIPNININEVNKAQYQFSATVNQIIYEGGSLSAAEDMTENAYKLSSLSEAVKFQKTKELISSLFYSALILQENIKVLNNAKQTLEENAKKIKSLVVNDVLLKNSIESIEIEIIQINQNITGLELDKKSTIESLAKWTGLDIKDSDMLDGAAIAGSSDNVRPEYAAFDLYEKAQDISKRSAYSAVMPQLYAYVKAGAGNPNPFNQFEQNLSSFYIAGIKLTWTPFDWGTASRKNETADLNKQAVKAEREDFQKSLDASISKEINEIEKYKSNVQSDLKIIMLRKNIAESKYSMLINGTVTVSEYIIDFNNLTNAQLNQNINKIKLDYSKNNLLIKSGKL